MGWSRTISDEVLECLYKLRLRESDQLKTVLELYDMEIHQKISMPNYQTLKTIAKRCIDQKLRWAVVKSRKGLSGVERGRGICYQWKEKGQCSEGDRHESNDRSCAETQNPKPPHLLTINVTRSKCVEEKKYPRQN